MTLFYSRGKCFSGTPNYLLIKKTAAFEGGGKDEVSFKGGGKKRLQRKKKSGKG